MSSTRREVQRKRRQRIRLELRTLHREGLLPVTITQLAASLKFPQGSVREIILKLEIDGLVRLDRKGLKRPEIFLTDSYASEVEHMGKNKPRPAQPGKVSSLPASAERPLPWWWKTGP